mgnify:FL=1|jgi:beta-glucosidase
MKIKAIIKQLTLEEKASLCSGENVWETKAIERIKIPSIMMADGPHGLRKQYDKSDNLGINSSIPATCFPTAATTACSFSKTLIFEMGQALANECINNDVDVILGPGVNIKRSPLCGRNFEYFSEDPYLSGELGKAFVLGVQSKGVGVSVKHFAGNNQEKLRHSISSEIDERAIREIYLSSFKKIIEANPYTIMCSYNRLNGEYASESKYLLTDILRKEWGFDGLLVTDWGACNDRVKGLKAGQDLEMPSSFGINDEKIVAAVKNGTLAEADLDKAVDRILRLVYKCQDKEKQVTNTEDNHLLAKKIASESMVLLKNNDNILPLKSSSIGIIGEFAKYPRIQGCGSSKVNPLKVETVYEVFKNNGVDFLYASGYSLTTDKTNKRLIEEAVEIARRVDIPIVFIGLPESYESEGFDRTHINLPPSHNELVAKVSEANSKTVVILSGGAPVVMPWINKVKVLLNTFLAGESASLAIYDILFGYVNPSGKLAETYPLKLEDTPCYNFFPGGNNAVYYNESIYVGYRYYELKKREVLFPFGYGLSYTTFSYYDLQINQKEFTEDEIVKISFKIKNTGALKGSEVCQLYISDIESEVFKPLKELKGFEKVELDINEERTLSFKLNKRDFSYYNVALKKWVLEAGNYEILIGASSKDIYLSEKITFNCDTVKSPYNIEEIPSYYDLSIGFNNDEFLKLKPNVQALNVKVKKPFDYNSTLSDISHSLVGKMFLMGIKLYIRKNTRDKATRAMMLNTLIDLPYRTLISFGGDVFTKNLADGLLMMANRKIIRGLIKVIKSK